MDVDLLHLFLAAIVFILLLERLKQGKDRPEPAEQPAFKQALDLEHFDEQPSEQVVSLDTVVEEIADAPETTKSILHGAAFVTDGDGLTINKTEIRLFGVDAPEMKHKWGRKAKSELFGLCKGQVITAEIQHVDHYGRAVARCYLPDGRDLSAEMVKLGLALDWPKYSGGEYAHLEVPHVRRKLYLAHARQQGRMEVWRQYDAQQKAAGLWKRPRKTSSPAPKSPAEIVPREPETVYP